jgi:hypothetical protein
VQILRFVSAVAETRCLHWLLLLLMLSLWLSAAFAALISKFVFQHAPQVCPLVQKKPNWSQPARDAFAWLYLPLLAVAASPAASGRPPSALTVARLTIWRFMCLLAHASYEYLHVQLLLNLDRRTNAIACDTSLNASCERCSSCCTCTEGCNGASSSFQCEVVRG